MKYATTLRHNMKYTADWLNYSKGGANNEVLTYDAIASGQIKFTGGIGPGQNMVIYTLEPLRLLVNLVNLRDSNGDLLLPSEQDAQGAVFQVRSCSPMLNVSGIAEGYRLNIIRI